MGNSKSAETHSQSESRKSSTKTSSKSESPKSSTNASNITKKDKIVKIRITGEEIEIHTVEMFSPKANLEEALNVLFLHGASFTSETWLEINTMEHVANWGHRAIAIDLPGLGQSRGSTRVSRDQPARFLAEVITQLDLERVVLVSPSMSGSYALPFLFSGSETNAERIVGFVPVAPVAVRDFSDKYSERQLPTLIVYGTNDERGVTSLEHLKLLPQHEVGAIEGARHACYMNNSEAFHNLLHNFLKKLSVAHGD